MIANSERQHRDRISRLGKYNPRVLPITVIFGDNASGKTNFFKALNFAKTLIYDGTRTGTLIPVEPFCLDDKSYKMPSRFVFLLLVDKTMYEFSFAVTSKAILEEKLVVINKNDENILYERKNGVITLDETLSKDQFLNFAYKGTRLNQLFLTNTVSQNINTFRPVYDWFTNNLEMIAPDSCFGPFEEFINEENPLYSVMNEILPQLDTGIIRVETMEFQLKNIPLPLLTKLQEEVKDGMSVHLTSPNNDRLVIVRKNGKLQAKKLVTYHRKEDGTEAIFDFFQESDGSQRLIDLLPVFLKLLVPNSKKVFVIDEIDRSLHPLLTRSLIEMYLSCCSEKTRSQLLLTTHEVLLMDQCLLRRDEMWVTERDNLGSTKFISFSDYNKTATGKDIRKNYLQGRFGCIPRILLSSIFPCFDEKNYEDN